MDEKSEMQRDAIDEVEMEPLVHCADVECGSSTPRTPRSEPRRFMLMISRRILLAFRDILRVTNRSLKSGEPNIRNGGLMVHIFGFTASKNDSLRETAWLDGLRGVAAFLVMVYHYHLDMFAFSTEAPYGSPNTKPWEIWRLPYLRIIWCSGHTQVGIFFVLSGFVLSWSSLSSIREGRHEKFSLSLSSSVFRRWMRLFVPCFLIGILSLLQFYFGLIELPVTRENTFVAQVMDYIWESIRFSNPFQLERTGFDVFHKYNHTMWTMPAEWAGSLAVFLVLLMVSRIRSYTKRTVILVLIPAYCCLSAQWNYWLFTTGILLADYVKQAGGFDQLSERMTGRSRMFWIVVLLIGGWLGGIPQKRDWYERPGYEWTDSLVPKNWQDIDGGGRYLWCWSGIMTIWGFSHFATLRRVFEKPSCRYLGKISFMLYLTHRMIGTIMGYWIRKQILGVLGTPYSTPEKPDVFLLEIRGFFWNIFAYVFAWACMLPMALALANWSTILVDEPSVRFAKCVDDIFVNGCTSEYEIRAA
ncbi:hypothetical protein ONS95_007324 [Cadophora gregata]|uniref:uncharacterized protein n=1 Tax=Cadophora gregata TaxID=51156 RepID=UPI0026DB182B|nr:uncharacterized protein ONS95_007324 [Cadophora gregata]KAK0100879.1 hypothetical protein ONS95_007324 [Cadophora gregata]KAK0117129.1 hypothetical protein ONS96_012963 [Cadophora gregata f. sp. sojae]